MGRSASRCPPLFRALPLAQRRTMEKYFTHWGKLLLPGPRPWRACARRPRIRSFLRTCFTACLKPVWSLGAPSCGSITGFGVATGPKMPSVNFPDLCVSPRGNYEPWLLFRKPLSEKTVAPESPQVGRRRTPRCSTAIAPIPDVHPQHENAPDRKAAGRPSVSQAAANPEDCSVVC